MTHSSPTRRSSDLSRRRRKMKKWTTLAMLAALPATAAIAAVPYHKMPPGFDAPPIRAEPIAGIVNQYWYNYRADILEAEKELSSDLRPATHRDDRRDAWEDRKSVV